MSEQSGELSLLNVGTGDTKISFDPSKPAEVKKASRAVKDMLKRGYAILIEVGKDENGPLYRRATSFDENTLEYIVVDPPTKPLSQTATGERREKNAERARTRRGRTSTRRVPARRAKGVAVAPTAGG